MCPVQPNGGPVIATLPRLHSGDNAENTCSIHYVKRALGVHRMSDRRAADYLSLMVEHHGFPPPLPCLVAKKLVTQPHPNSQWIRDAVDLWLFDWLPPEAAAALGRIDQDEAAAEMDAAAANLKLVGGRDLDGRAA